MDRWVQEDYAASRYGYHPHSRVHRHTLEAPGDASTMPVMASDFHERTFNVFPTHSTWTPPFTQGDDTYTHTLSTHYPLDAHLFRPSVGVPPIYTPVPPSLWGPTDDSTYHPPAMYHPNTHLVPVVPPPRTFARPPMRTHDTDGHNSMYSPLPFHATAPNHWCSTAPSTPVAIDPTWGVPPNPPFTPTDHNHFIHPPPGDYPAPPNGDRGTIALPNPRRRRRNRRRNNAPDTGPSNRKDNLKRAQTDGETHKPAKRSNTGTPSLDDRRGAHKRPMRDEAAGRTAESRKFRKISVSGGIGGSGGSGRVGGNGGTGTGPEFNFHFHCSERDRNEDSSS
ncbi:hypothetical protein K438DRAFT_2012636 [Mycena galopus ATCC 62051]|nr:hypothetical protein K438DRAFT_2012636 [Mycena galopus ATCC 62051]